MPQYPVTDKQTGDKWIIDAETPERAKQVAALRRAARQGTLKYEDPADEPTLLGFLKESVEAPYRGEPGELPGFLQSMGRTYKEGVKSAGRLLAPPFMREDEAGKFDPVKRLGEAGSDVFNVIGMSPPLAAMTAAAAQSGKIARNWGASPLVAGLVSQGVGLAYPSLAKRGATRAAARAEERAAKEAADITERQTPSLKAAGELRKVREQQPSTRLAGELRTQRAEREAAEAIEARTPEEKSRILAEGEKRAADVTTQAKEFADMTEQEARQALEDLKSYPQVARATAEAVKRRIAQNPVSEFEFGESFKGPEFQPRGQPKQGYYRQAEQLRREEANALYSEARSTAGDVPLPAEKILAPILEDMKREGVAVQILPTKAERVAGRIEQELDPLTQEQRAYGDILDKLTPEQRQRLRAGTAGGVMPLDIYRALFQDVLPQSARAGTSGMVGSLGGRELASREAQVLKALDSFDVPQQLTTKEALALHQRLNGAIRAAERSKDFSLARQFRRYKDAVDKGIGEANKDALGKLAEADLFYARDYAPYFDPRSKLYKISQQKAASVVDSLVSKEDPRLTEKALSILDEEGKDALRGAWIQRVFENSVDDFSNSFSPKKLAETYRSYLPEVRKAMLGEDGVRQMDEIIDGMAKRTQELRDIKNDRLTRAQQAKAALPQAKAAGADMVKEAREQAKELGETAKARVKTAREAENFSRERLSRQTSELAKTYEAVAEKIATETVQFAKQEAERLTPKTHGILGFSNLQVQGFLGVLDVAEWMGGAGGRRYLVYAARHGIAYYLATHPEKLGQITGFGKNALSIVNRAINGNPLDPAYINRARAFWLLAEQAEIAERKNAREQTGVENPQGR